MRSTDAARPRPDRVAVSSAIGPLPAIVVPAPMGIVTARVPVPLHLPDRQHDTSTQTLARPFGSSGVESRTRVALGESGPSGDRLPSAREAAELADRLAGNTHHGPF